MRRRAACRNAKESWTTRAFGLIRQASLALLSARRRTGSRPPGRRSSGLVRPSTLPSVKRPRLHKRARPSYARASPALKPSDWLPRFGYGTGDALLKTTRRRTHYAHRRRFRRRSERTRSFSLAAALPRDRVFRPAAPYLALRHPTSSKLRRRRFATAVYGTLRKRFQESVSRMCRLKIQAIFGRLRFSFGDGDRGMRRECWG